MESNKDFDSEVKLALDGIQFVGEVEYVDPNSLISHPSSLWVYDDQDADTVARDTEFMLAIRKHGGNITPVLVDSHDRKTILSGDRRRTGCAILGFPVRVQYVNPGEKPGDVENFIITSNLRRPQLTNLQLGRSVKLLRDAAKARLAAQQAAAPAEPVVDNQPAQQTQDAPVAAPEQTESKTLAEAFPSIAATGTTPVVEDDSIIEGIADNLGVPKTRVKEAVKVVDHIDKLKEEGKTEEAEKLSDKLNKSTRQAAETVRVRSDYNHTPTAALKILEKDLRAVAKGALEGLKKVPSCDPKLRDRIVESFTLLYSLVGELGSKEKEAAKSLPKGSKSKKPGKDANESAPKSASDFPADTVSGAAEAAPTADSNNAEAGPEAQESTT